MSKVELQVRQLMPEDLPLVDDNSDFTLMGYQNFLIEPRVGTSSTSSLQLILILRENADLFKSNLRIGLSVCPSQYFIKYWYSEYDGQNL